jgi:hypothetical protein
MKNYSHTLCALNQYLRVGSAVLFFTVMIHKVHYHFSIALCSTLIFHNQSVRKKRLWYKRFSRYSLSRSWGHFEINLLCCKQLFIPQITAEWGVCMCAYSVAIFCLYILRCLMQYSKSILNSKNHIGIDIKLRGK